MTNVLTVQPTAPGGWLAAVIPGRLAVVQHTADDDGFAARLWAALNDDDGMRLVIDELAKDGLTKVPSFVLAEWNGSDASFDGRFIVRGGAGVAIATARGDEDITARGVSTWVERPVTGISGFRIECLPSEPVAGPSLPLVLGTAWASALAFGSLASPSAAGGFADVADGIPASKRTAPVAVPAAPQAAAAVAAQVAAAPVASVPADNTPVASAPVDVVAAAASVEAAAEPVVVEPDASPVARQASDDEVDLDRTIADLEATVAGQDASEPAFTKDPEAQADDRAPDVQAADGAGVQDAPHETTGYDHLFGATMMRSVEDAAARPPAEEGEASAEAAPVTVVPPAPLAVAPPAPAQTGDGLGDHDGLTVMSGDLRALRDTAASSPQPAAPQPAAATTEPPTAEPPAAPVEAGFVLQLPDGAAEPIDGMVVVGRAPSVSKMGGGRVPRLVTVDSVEHDISRNHVQLTIEGGTVVVTDLHSRNGTLIALPGKSPQKLRAGEPTSVIAGTVIDLGSGVTLGVVQA